MTITKALAKKRSVRSASKALRVHGATMTDAMDNYTHAGIGNTIEFALKVARARLRVLRDASRIVT